jgi:hypothetical protein
MPTGDLSGVWAKIDRAIHHLKDLASTLDSWGTSEMKDHSPGIDYDAERNCLKVFLKEVIPNDIHWPLLIGDIAHNLRSALDHLACQLAIVSCKPASCCKRTAFPICLDEDSFDRAKTKIEPFVRPEIFAMIQGIQPYIAANVRGMPVKSSNLAIISELDIIDKHRMLVVARKQGRVTHISYSIDEGESIDVPHSSKWFPLKDGAQIAEIDLGSSVLKGEEKMHVKAETQVQIFFSETGYGCDGLEVIAILDSCVNYVTAIVNEFEARFFAK